MESSQPSRAEEFQGRLSRPGQRPGGGFCYTVGSLGSAIGPASTGLFSSHLGIGKTFILVSSIFLIGAVVVSRFPETIGKKL